ELSDTDVCEELEHIKQWASTNKLNINVHKTKEIIFHRPCTSLTISVLPAIDRLSVITLLGTNFTDTLSFSPHIKHLLSVCSQRMYLLKSLKLQGLHSNKLKMPSLLGWDLSPMVIKTKLMGS